MRRNLILGSVLLAALTLGAGSAFGDLVTPPHQFADGFWLINYKAPQVDYSPKVVVDVNTGGTKNAGTINFQYRLFNGNFTGPGNPVTDGAAALDWTFKKSPDIPPLKNNFQLAWVQIVRAATNPGVQQWGAGPGEWFVDNGGSFTNPSYALGNSSNDYPNRPLAVDESWNAELALTCIDKASTELRIIGSVLWGFDIVSGVSQEGSIYGNPSPTWGPALPNFSATILRDWPGVADFHTWTVNTKPCFVPEPATLALLAFGGLMLATRRRR